jgi:hypothetical protein
MECAWSLDGWYFRRQETLLGPVTSGELQQLVAGGQLRKTDTIWQGWKRAQDRLLLPTIVLAVVDVPVPVDRPTDL